ncbi:MAG: GtrA family protein [Frankiales bacterium]|nr:GtrA family protein [Frankiales bacterium]
MPVSVSLVQRLRDTVDTIFHEIAKFGIVGAANFVIDAGIFNLLLLTKLGHKPVTAAVISTSIAIVSSYFMNRHWTWRHAQRAHPARELVLFFLISALGLVIALACLGLSHYVLDFRSVLADNISKNGFGLLLGMVWRFWAFKRWIFLPVEDEELAETDSADLAVRTTI